MLYKENELGDDFVYEKKMHDYKGNIMATAPYAFYTKEAIDRLVAIWCDNVVSLVNYKSQNVVCK